MGRIGSPSSSSALQRNLVRRRPRCSANGGRPVNQGINSGVARVSKYNSKIRCSNVSSNSSMSFSQILRVAEYASTGVAFHHAGLDTNDRVSIERAYLEGNINVICCTSTLAVGVNLPCHLVIIKNTLVYDQTGNKEYSDLEIMQMLGRAGRPQFDTSAIAVIMTRNDKVQHYENMMSGQEVLESRLHINLIEHLVRDEYRYTPSC